jgi:hypothetical protein
MHVHGDNLQQKETGEAKYADAESRRFLREIRKQYGVWKKANEKLKGPLKTAIPQDTETLRQRVALFTTYNDFIDQQKYAEKFDSRSNLHSSVLEEFIYYLFRDLIADSWNARSSAKRTHLKIFSSCRQTTLQCSKRLTHALREKIMTLPSASA